MRRRSTGGRPGLDPGRGRGLALAAACALAVAGCGDSGGTPIPRAAATDLINDLEEVDRRVQANACNDVREETLPRIDRRVDELPGGIDADVRGALEDGVARLRSLVEDECAAREPPPAPEPVDTAPQPTVPEATVEEPDEDAGGENGEGKEGEGKQKDKQPKDQDGGGQPDATAPGGAAPAPAPGAEPAPEGDAE